MEPANKRRKLASSSSDADLDVRPEDGCVVSGGHPLGIKPWGNFYLDGNKKEDEAIVRKEGLGMFAVLPDELLQDLLVFVEDARDLSTLGTTSKFMYAFANEEELWKELVTDTFGGSWVYEASWKRTFVRRVKPDFIFAFPPDRPPFTPKTFYSDVLFHTWKCSTIDLLQYTGEETIPRRSNLSLEEFIREYGAPNKPVIITDIVPNWPAYKEWTKSNLIKNYGDIEFQIGRVAQKLSDYVKYVEAAPRDDQPLYLFDNDFGEKAPQLAKDYTVPEYFQEDYFSLLKGNDRPSYRWILIGPVRSGSTFHKDPNYTSAWNGLISGAKKWVMYPPDVTPPGCFPSEDEFDVTTPVSVTEWFVNYYKDAKKNSGGAKGKLVECIQRPGELVFIPNAWWHLALNLEECVAVTQNVVNRQNLANVAEFLQRKKKKDLWNQLSDALQKEKPDVYSWLMVELEKKKKPVKKDSTGQNSLWGNPSGTPWKLSFNFGASQAEQAAK